MHRFRGLGFVSGTTLAVVALSAVMAAGTAAAGSIIALPRPGQVGLSVGGLYGGLTKSGTISEQFGTGPGMFLRLRYRARYERGFGLTFESHLYDPRSAATMQDLVTKEWYESGSDYAYKRASVYLYGVDFYQMFDTRSKTVKMLSAGAGLAHSVFTFNDNESQYPLSDGPYVQVGAGLEQFFWRSMAFELGARYSAIFLGKRVDHDLQATIGIMFYASL